MHNRFNKCRKWEVNKANINMKAKESKIGDDVEMRLYDPMGTTGMNRKCDDIKQ